MKKLALCGIIVSVVAMMGGNASAVTLASKGYVDDAIQTVEGELNEHASDTTIHQTATDIANAIAAAASNYATAAQGALADSAVQTVTTTGTTGVVKTVSGNSNGTVTVTRGAIENADISSTAAIDVSKIAVPESCNAASHLCVLTWKTDKEGGAGWVLVDVSDTPTTAQ